jgi:exodeoxyribonuclease VII small subunit
MTDHPGQPPVLGTVRAVIDDGSFEEALAALEHVVAHLEQGRLSLDETMTWYELGLRLSRRCSEHLAQAELRISVLDAEYQPLASWDAESERDES